MTNVSEWSVTAGLNTNSPPDGWPEGMARSAVNDTAREMMGALARWYQDSNGSLATTGGTTAYALTTNSVYTSLSDIPLLVFNVNAENTGPVTLNVDGLGVKPWRKSALWEDYLPGELVDDHVVVVAYNADSDDFCTVGPVGRSEFQTGTSMVFYEATAPTGWTAVAEDDKALRVVLAGTTGGTTGGTTSFSDVFDARIIDVDNLPSHDHDIDFNTSTDGAHTHTEQGVVALTTATPGATPNICHNVQSQNTGSSGSHNHDVIGSTDDTGGDEAMDFDVQHLDVIVATKD